MNISHRNVEKKRRKEEYEQEKKALKYSMRDLIDQMKITNFSLVIVCMLLAGIFIKLVFWS